MQIPVDPDDLPCGDPSSAHPVQFMYENELTKIEQAGSEEVTKQGTKLFEAFRSK